MESTGCQQERQESRESVERRKRLCWSEGCRHGKKRTCGTQGQKGLGRLHADGECEAVENGKKRADRRGSE